MRLPAALRIVPLSVLGAGTGVLAMLGTGCCSSGPPVIRVDKPDLPLREFRGVFVATAYNVDWPYKMNLHRSEQISEIKAIVRRAKELNFNVVMLQVRAFGDRIHRRSTLRVPERWSNALNHGHDPDKLNGKYDPLEEWVRACHQEGLELHAWINPFRVDNLVEVPGKGTLPVFANDEDGHHLYLDPQKQSVQDYVLSVIDDLLNNYTPAMMSTRSADRVPDKLTPGGGDGMGMAAGAVAALELAAGGGDGADGIIFDHYIPGGNGGGTRPAAVGGTPGMMLRARRIAKPGGAPTPRVAWLIKKAKLTPVPNDSDANLDDFIKKVYERANCSGIKFGISPDYDDTRAQDWVQQGWCHYVIPELYDLMGTATPNNLESRLKSWLEIVPRAGSSPLVVAGLYTARIHVPAKNTDNLWPASEIEGQIKHAREYKVSKGKSARGQAHYSWSSLRSQAQGGPDLPDNIGEKLIVPSNNNDHYAEPALVPQCTAPLDPKPGEPTVTLNGGAAHWHAASGDNKRITLWVVRLRRNGVWDPAQLLGPSETSIKNLPAEVDKVAVAAVDRHNQVSDYGVSR